MSNGRKIGKLNFIKMKDFCASKDTVEKVKRQTREREKTFANHRFDEELPPRIYKELLQLNNKKGT